MVVCRYEISLVAFNSTSYSFALLTRELSSWTLEEKFRIYTRPCIIRDQGGERLGDETSDPLFVQCVMQSGTSIA